MQPVVAESKTIGDFSKTLKIFNLVELSEHAGLSVHLPFDFLD